MARHWVASGLTPSTSVMSTHEQGGVAGRLVVVLVERGVAGADGLVDDGERPGHAEVVVHRGGELGRQRADGRVGQPGTGQVAGGQARRRKPSIRSTAASASRREPSWYSIVDR